MFISRGSQHLSKGLVQRRRSSQQFRTVEPTISHHGQLLYRCQRPRRCISQISVCCRSCRRAYYRQCRYVTRIYFAHAHLQVRLQVRSTGRIGVSRSTFDHLTERLKTLFSQVDVANSLSPPAVPGKTLAVGDPGAGRKAPYMLNYDTNKEKRIFGLKYKTMEEISRDMLVEFNRRGWSVSKRIISALFSLSPQVNFHTGPS